MPPTQDYRLPDGRKVPGVTTVNKNLGWSTENLIRWSNRQGLAGIDVRSREGQRAADVGTLIHSRIEADVWGAEPAPVPEDMRAQVEQGHASFKRWLGQTAIQIVATEVFGVNEEYEAGWCADGVGLESDGLSLLDWKSGGGPYPEHLIQVATYVRFFEELVGCRMVGAHVCRFGKDTGIFHQVFFPRDVLDVGFKAWTLARGLHAYKPQIERLVR